MISVHSTYDTPAWFRADPVSETNNGTLHDICLYLSATNYNYITIEEATALRDVLTVGIEKAMTARKVRYEKAVAKIADLTKRGMGGVTE